MKKAMVIAVVLAVVICTATVWSQGRPGPGGPGGPGGPMMACPAMAVMPPQAFMLDRMAEMLQLTDDQTTKLNDVASKSDETMRSLSRKAAESSRALREALLAADFDAENVKDLAATAEKAEAAVVSAGIDAWTEIRSILTEDQIAELREAMNRPHPGPGERPMGPPPVPPLGPPPGPPPPPAPDE